MKFSTSRGIVLCSLLLASACVTAPKPLYYWGDYQKALLSYAKNPQEVQKFADQLKFTIEKAEIQDAVPPGVYAEYGYALLELNQAPEAIVFFGKERAKWPESVPLMTRLIDRLSNTGPVPFDPSAQPARGDGRPVEIPVQTPVVPTTTPSIG